MDFITMALLGKLVLFGDSLSVGANWFLKTQPAVTLSGRGVTHPWESQVHTLVGPDDTLVVVLGTNDAAFWGARGEAAYRARIRELITVMAARAKQVVWVGPPCSFAARWSEWLPQIDRILSSEIAAAKLPNVRYVSMFPHTMHNGTCSRDGRAPDGIHFTPDGYRRLADYIRENLPK